MISGGFLGEMFAALALSGAWLAFAGFSVAGFGKPTAKQSWERIAVAGFSAHIIGIFGIIATLFYLIYTHNYAYHYVWSHSSNELPVYYMISCFWEGQEGSFLLWTFWHSVLGGILLFKGKEWRNGVLAVIASIELILTSMILGIFVPENVVWLMLALMALVPGLWLLRSWWVKREIADSPNPLSSVFQVSAVVLSLLTLLLLMRRQTGFFTGWSLGNAFSGIDSIGFSLFLLAFAGFLGLFILYIRKRSDSQADVGDLIAGMGVAVMAFIAAMVEPGLWKLGSTPFMTLRTAFPDAEIYLTDPNFLPSNGSGLNPLLQNYWMVIHPPTLFLGFAATAIPFAYVISGLIQGKYREWIRPATPWMLFAVMILGIGIIMGGYWAYETLNFGGYWNWDPVENSSFVPWICGVAALHAMLIHQRTKTYLHLTLILIISTFLLVLYSTFLTRSGILGETSVHSFTDLGLSGQLLVLVLVYFFSVSLLLAVRWKQIPSQPDESKVWSPEFFLFLGTLVLIFAGLEIIFTTSLPAINKLAGTNMAPPADLSYFYYKWNVWFASAFGVFSGIGQFLWWKIREKKKLADALFRPFLVAMVAGSLVIVALTVGGMEFVHDDKTAALIAPENLGEGFLSKALAYIQFGFLSFTNELLLFTSLFAVFSNGDVLVSLLRKNKKGWKVMGGTVVHLGFGLMLLGMLFSSGYGDVVSKNLTPEDLAGFPEAEKADNVLLVKGRSRMIPGYSVTYTGKKEAQAPVSSVSLIERNEAAFKVSFKDSTGDVFAMVLPLDVFLQTSDGSTGEHDAKPAAKSNDPAEPGINLEYVEDFLNRNLEFLKPKHINNRTLYGLEFVSLTDTASRFTLYPEAEVNEDMGNILAHPARKIYWNKDIYVHVSSTPAESDESPEFKYYDFELRIGESAFTDRAEVRLVRMSDLSGNKELEGFPIAAAANLEVIVKQDTFLVKPVYLIGKDNKPGMIEDHLEDLFMDFAFVGVDPEKGIVQIQVQEQVNPNNDWVVIKALSKPWINLLWLGTFVLTFGFIISILRRIRENKGR
jgi:cytochrome c-type biogenesis protein CcmF